MRRLGRLILIVVCLGLVASWPVGYAQSAQPTSSLDQARRWLDESQALRKAGKYDDALGVAEKALAVRERELDANDAALADALHLVALVLDDKGEYAKAEPISRRALAIREQALGPDHPDVAQSLLNLAWIVKSRQDFGGAESLYQRALDIQERALGPDDLDVATTLNDLAVLYNQTGRYDEAIRTHHRALALRERAGNLDGVGLSLNNLARVYMNKGDYESGADTYRRSLSNWEAAVGPDHPRVANALDGLAQAATASGDYATAEPLQLRVLAIREKALGPDHPEVATTLNNLAVIYREKGDFERAVPLLLRDLAITEAKLGPDHSFVAPTLSNLGLIHQQRQEYAQAEARFRRALAIQEGALGPGHLAVGMTLSRLGRLYVEDRSKDAVDAEALLQRALTTLEKAVGPNHPEIAVALTGLATLKERQGDDVASEGLLRRALATQEAVLGALHPDVGQSLDRLAATRQRAMDTSTAIAYLTRAHDIRERQLARNLPLGSDRQRVNYLELFTRDLDRAISLHAQDATNSAGALDLALTTLLRRKGRALDASRDSVAVLRQRAADSQRALFEELASARAQLSAVTLRGPAGASPAAYQANLRRLGDRVDRLESDLSAESAVFRAESLPISVDTVQRAIPADSVLIEYVVYHPTRPTYGRSTPSRFVAYVLGPGTAVPRWVDLGEADAINAAVRSWRDALRDPRRHDAARLARALDALVLEPVRPLLRDASHLLIAPDGSLNLIPFAALQDEQQRYLLERHTVTLLTSGRDLLRLQVLRDGRGPAVVVAAPAFGEPTVVASAAGAAPARPRVDTSRTFFGPLPGANDEVRALRALLPAATFLTGPQATESALRRLSGPRILHVATHGFFRERDAAGADATAIDDPLLRSGLALAGANRGGQDDDGILTALEAAGLDLWGTGLVVLSACDTGVGDVRNGDGVHGLRRALVLAGAESQLMTLWPVSDRSTRELVVSYYRQITAGLGRGDALRRAQLDVMSTPRFAHPYYWASFILSGAWTSMRRGAVP
jgi:CHAT domain-containing protein/tetratricopeptide (TPR) repeat protein